jgi:outer membrane immunogenic protein
MKRLLVAGALLAGLSATAGAADLPARAPVYVAPVFSWTGFYVGVNAGGAWANNNCGSFNPIVGGVAVVGFPNNCFGGNGNGSFTGGVQAGYNVQYNNLVMGIEADFNGVSRNGNNNGIIENPYNGLNHPYDGSYVVNGGRSANYFGTVRARFGYAIDRALIYATGGLAWSGGNSGTNVAFYHNQVPPLVGGASALFTSNSDTTHFGWTLGAGLEYAISNNWTVKGEYLYIHSNHGGNGSFVCTDVVAGTCGSFTTAAATFLNNRSNNSLNIARVGVNYKF